MGVRSFVPLVHVASVPRSTAFYAKLGFAVANQHESPQDAEPVWAWLQSGDATLMCAKAENPIDDRVQGVLFYAYVDDVPVERAALGAAGVACGEITYPFWAPRGEFRIVDPDGYVVMVTHT